MSDSLQPHRLQHSKLPCPSPSPGACSNSCPLSQWCYPTILSSIVCFSSCLQSFPESGSFLMSQLFSSGGCQLQNDTYQEHCQQLNNKCICCLPLLMSEETEPCAAIAVDFQQSLREFRVKSGTLCSRESDGTGLWRVGCFQGGFSDSSAGKESSCSAGNPCSIPGSGSSPGVGIGYPFQCSWTYWAAQR